MVPSIARKGGGYIDKKNLDAKVFTVSYSNSLCQAFDGPHLVLRWISTEVVGGEQRDISEICGREIL